MADRDLMSPMGTDYEPPESLWKLITSYIAESEWEEVKFMLGEDLVEQSIELHQEVETLLEIWQEYREETQKTLQRTRLPEPPAARDRLKQEIQFFVHSLQDKAKENGRDPQLVLSRHNSTVIDYALDSGYNSSSLPSTGRSSSRGSGRSSGRSTPLRAPDSARSTGQVRISMKEELDAMNDKLSVYKFDAVVKDLQNALQAEVDNLLADTEFLQLCLNDEADIRCDSSMGLNREPSLADMREERSKLEKELLLPETPVTHPTKLPPRREASSLAPKSVPPVLPMSTLPKPARPLSSSKPLGPLKANHALSPPSDLSPPNSAASASSVSSIRPTVRRAGQFSQRTVGQSSRDGVRSGGGSSSSGMQNTSSMQSLTANISHITIKTGGGGGSKGGEGDKNSGVVAKDAGDASVVAEATAVVPTPPKSAKPGTQRPRSAQRFRQMVMECRDGK